MAPDVGWTKGNTPKGSLDIAAVAEWTDGESSLPLTSRGSYSLVRDEPLLRWMNPLDPTSTRFTLDDVAESMEREALNHAWGALREVVVPTSRVFT